MTQSAEIPKNIVNFAEAREKTKPLPNIKRPTHDVNTQQEVYEMLSREINPERRLKLLNPRLDIIKGKFNVDCTDPNRCRQIHSDAA